MTLDHIKKVREVAAKNRMTPDPIKKVREVAP